MINSFRNYSLLLVVFIHTHIYLIDYSGTTAPVFLQYFYFNFLSFFHPASLLAAISGYLFFRDFSVNHKNWSTFYGEKYFKRMKSVFIPYFFWISFFFVINNLLIFLSSLTDTHVFVSQHSSLSPGNYIKSFFYPEYAVARHLWYLNNLLFAFALAPVILMVNRSKPMMLVATMLVVVLYYFYLKQNPNQALLIVKYRFIIFFIAGAFLGLNKKYLVMALNNKLRLVLFFGTLFVLTYASTFFFYDYALVYVINSVSVVILVSVGCYMLVRKYIPNRDVIYNRSNHFLLYIIHPFILSVLCKLLFYPGLFRLSNYYVLFVLGMVLTFLVVQINNFCYKLLSTRFKTLARNVL